MVDTTDTRHLDLLGRAIMALYAERRRAGEPFTVPDRTSCTATDHWVCLSDGVRALATYAVKGGRLIRL